MKKNVFISFMMVFLLPLDAETLPWPAATSEALYLPFGLQWFQEMDAIKKTIVDYGPVNCNDQSCRWVATVEEGTAIFELSFHFNTLVGFKLDYVLERQAGMQYIPKLEKLKQSTREWVVKDLRAFPQPAAIPGDEYSAENKDSRIIVKWREGEHSLFISIEMKAK